jgi:hypothetical protein
MSAKLKDISYDLLTGIYTVLKNFVFTYVDQVTLTGTSGTATVVNNGISITATFATSLIITAQNFVTANAAAYLASGVTLTANNGVLIFTSNTPGLAFTGNTTITNASGNLAGSVANANVLYPVYKTIPKSPAATFVYIGKVIYSEDGSKENFVYNGSVQVHVVDESSQRGDLMLSEQILNVVRGLLKPAKATVFSCGNSTLDIFSLNSTISNVILNEDGNAIVRLVDTYDFLIE